MSETIDNRVVSITFDNRQFERGVAETLTSIAKLEKSLNFESAGAGIAGVSAAMDHVNFGGLAAGIENISSKFTAMGAVGFTVISNLTTAALDFAKKTAGDILGPVITGGKSRAENIEQAKFLFRGLGLDVEAGMQAALNAVKGTAFGLDEAAKIAAQFGATGIAVGKDMTSALRGIAGAAALTGTSFAEMGDIFVSSAGTGVVNTQDLQQFATRGLNAASAVAKELGITEQAVREMASAGELDFKTFAKAMDSAFGEHATKANETFSGALANMRAAMSRLGASFFGPQMEQSRDLFNALTPVIDNITKALQPLIGAVLVFGGSANQGLIKMLKDLDTGPFALGIALITDGLTAFYKLIVQIKDIAVGVFKDMFPDTEAHKFVDFALGFRDFAQSLTITGETAGKIASVFRGLFSIFTIGWTILKELGGLFFDLVGTFYKFSGTGVGEFFSKTADSLAAMKASLVDGGGIAAFFDSISQTIQHPIESLQKFADYVTGLFDGVDIPGAGLFADLMDRISARFETLAAFGRGVGDVFGWLSDRLQGVRDALSEAWDYISGWFADLGNRLAEVISPADFDAAVDAVNVGLIGGILVTLRKFLNGGLRLDLGGGFFEQVSGVLDQLTGTLKAMQQQVKADILVKIAKAVAILTASVLVLSLIDSGALTRSLTALAVGFGQLVAAMAILNKIAADPKGAAQMALLSGGMIALSSALLILSGAVAILAQLSPEELALGLGGIAVLLTEVTVAAIPLSKNSGGLISAGIGMGFLAAGLVVMSIAVRAFAGLDWQEMVKGFGGIAVGLGLVIGALHLVPEDMPLIAAEILAISAAMVVMAFAVGQFAQMSWEELGKGLLGVAVALAIIVTALHAMPDDLGTSAGQIILVAGAMVVLATAVRMLAELSLDELIRGLGGVALALGVMVVAMNAMTGTIAGAAALVIATAALYGLSQVISIFAKLSLEEIAKGLLAIVAVMVVLGIAATLMAPATVALLEFGLAMTAVGLGFALFGVGAFLVAKAFEALAGSTEAGAKNVVNSLVIISGAIPAMAQAIAQGLIELLEVVIKALPGLIKGLTVVLEKLLETVIKLAPKIAEALVAIISEALKAMGIIIPQAIDLGIKLLEYFLMGVRDNISLIVQLGGDILTNFLQGIADNIGNVVTAAFNILTAFINAISANIQMLIDAGSNMIVNVVLGFTQNVSKIASAITLMITTFLTEIGRNGQKIVDAGGNMIIGLIWGISRKAQDIVTAGTNAAISFLDGMISNAVNFVDRLGSLIVKLLDGMTQAIKKHDDDIAESGGKLAHAIIDAIIKVVKGAGGEVVKAVTGVFGSAVDGVKSFLGINSPSRVFMEIGDSMMEGLVKAVNADKTAENAVVDKAIGITSVFGSTLQAIPDALLNMDEFNPTITPVLDLTQVQKDSKAISAYLGTTPLEAGVSTAQANDISTATNTPPEDTSLTPTAGPTSVTFEQNNYSPKALTTGDIYKSTRSQLALAKEELAIP